MKPGLMGILEQSGNHPIRQWSSLAAKPQSLAIIQQKAQRIEKVK